MKSEIRKSLFSQAEYKKKFKFSELYRAFIYVPGAIVKLTGNKKNKLIDKQLVERLMLAVTEVNGCPACSYAHTIMALRQGMSNDEINSFLSGDDKYIKPEEARAIIFAQHFADTRGYPKKDVYEVIVREYGAKKAGIIMSAVQLMLAGNIYGIPYSAFHSRMKGKPYKDSSPGYELGMLIVGTLCLPVAFIHALIRWLTGMPNMYIDNSSI